MRVKEGRVYICVKCGLKSKVQLERVTSFATGISNSYKRRFINYKLCRDCFLSFTNYKNNLLKEIILNDREDIIVIYLLLRKFIDNEVISSATLVKDLKKLDLELRPYIKVYKESGNYDIYEIISNAKILKKNVEC